MGHVIVFYCAQLVACWYAIRAGGRPERLVALLLAAAALATSLNGFVRLPSFATLDMLRLAIDGLLLAGLVAVALVADRYWPLWLSALHLVAMAVHGVRIYDPGLVPWMYAAAVGKIAYPMMALLVVGTARHAGRVARHGGERDWTPRAVLLP